MRYAIFILAAALPLLGQDRYAFANAQQFLNTSCKACHFGKGAVGGFDVTKFTASEPMLAKQSEWSRAVMRVKNGEMPPKGAPAPSFDAKDHFTHWVEASLRTEACADGITPGRAMVRRLNRTEYTATVRDLLNIPVNAGRNLPSDGAGGEGFDNAAETLFLSPIHAEKYLEAAKEALDYGNRDPRSRSVMISAEPGGDVSELEAAYKVLEDFVPRAFRRPARPGEVASYIKLFHAARGRKMNWEESILYAMSGVMISPKFLFHAEAPNETAEPKLVGQYEMASRLSFFLWSSSPDPTLMRLARQGKMQDPDELRRQVVRMLKAEKSREFAENFTEQWLGTRELGRDIKPDEKLFPEYYEPEVMSGIRHEPFLFMHEILMGNLPLTDLLDSDWTVVASKLAKYYNFGPIEGLRQQPIKVKIPEGSHRGGLLGMAAIHAVSSYPHRTSPVLRGKWILDNLLGTPPPPPPPDVPLLPDNHDGDAPKTLRERLELHRANAVCASCHDRIDPLGFGMENFDVVGRWRDQDAGKPIDTHGVLPDGTQFEGVDGLKKVLLDRKDDILRNLVTKMLGYALGRALNVEDSCTVDRVMDALRRDNYKAHTLIEEIVLSVPFRYQRGTDQRIGVGGTEIPREATPR
ncbi:MAG: DUF1592 domain-containing protein [Acidobacteriota bacterium]